VLPCANPIGIGGASVPLIAEADEVVSTSGAGGLASTEPFFNSTSSFATISAGAAIAAYSFLGFDAVTTLTEETINPRKNMPRAIMLIALIGGGIFVTVSYVTQLVHPGGVFEDSASAASSAGAVRVRPRSTGQRLAPAVRDGPGLGPAQGRLRPAQR
jgi:amino acid transporter